MTILYTRTEMNAAAFLVSLGRNSHSESSIRDPLAEVRRYLSEYGETAEGKALSKVLQTLVSGEGEFSDSEVWLFGTETRALVAALVKARIEGVLYSKQEWNRATGP